VIRHQVTNTLGKKSKLRAFIEEARGQKLTREELRPGGFDLESLLNLNVQLSMVHHTPENSDQVYANQ
jgi:hypothetical protein